MNTTATPTMILEPEKWANDMQNLAVEYVGMPEQTIFEAAARRFRALAAHLKLEPHDPRRHDGFVVMSEDR